MRDDLETEMMSSRLKVFCFKYQIPLIFLDALTAFVRWILRLTRGVL